MTTTRHLFRRTPLQRLDRAVDRVMHTTGYLALAGVAVGGVLLALSAMFGRWVPWLPNATAGVVAVALAAGFVFAAAVGLAWGITAARSARGENP